MLTLSYGYKKPQTNDRGSVFWSALEFDIQRLNDHTHNGTNSAKLTAASSMAVTIALASADWASIGGGLYRQLATISGSVLFADAAIQFRGTTDGKSYYLDYLKVSASTFYVYINDNSKDITAILTT